MKITLPTLYCRTNSGKVQVWEITVDGGKFFTTEGLQGGAMTVSAPTVCRPKNVGRSNETAPQEQARLEACAKWQKKKDAGYFEKVGDIDNEIHFEPMLAHKYEDYKDKIVFPVYAQPKLDGIRCIARKSGLWSRNGKQFVACPHIEKALKAVFAFDPTIVLDGELYADKLANDFNKICSLVKRSKPTAADLKEAAKGIEYWVYDLPAPHGGNFSARHAELKTVLHGLAIYGVKVLYTAKCEDEAELTGFYEHWIDEGYEGQIVRLDKPYENKRSKNLLKRKEFIDDEFVVVDIVEGEGGRTGTAGYMELSLHGANGHKTFRSNIKGNFDFLKQVLRDRKKLIGEMVTVRYFCLTPDGIPRFPYVVAIRDYE